MVYFIHVRAWGNWKNTTNLILIKCQQEKEMHNLKDKVISN